MKQFLSITVAIVYLLLSTGIQINAHYCLGELESVKVLVESETCCCGNDDLSSNCCSNENISLLADIDNHLGAESRITLPDNEILLNTFNCTIDNDNETETEKLSIPDKDISPPLKQAVWLLNCSLTYYG